MVWLLVLLRGPVLIVRFVGMIHRAPLSLGNVMLRVARDAEAEVVWGCIHAGLEGAVVNTAALKDLKTTIAYATAIVAGLNRGRKKLGG